MVNSSEQKIKSMMEAKGFTVHHNGAPDFLCYKLNKRTRMPENIMFVEVKSGSSRVSNDQLKWGLVLESLGASINYIRADDPKDVELLLKEATV